MRLILGSGGALQNFNPCHPQVCYTERWPQPGARQRRGTRGGFSALCAFFLFQEKAATGTETMVGRWSPPRSRASTLSTHAHNRSHLLPHAQRTQASRPWKMGRLQPTLLQSAPQKSTCLLPVHAPSSLFRVVLPGVSSAGPILQWGDRHWGLLQAPAPTLSTRSGKGGRRLPFPGQNQGGGGGRGGEEIGKIT